MLKLLKRVSVLVLLTLPGYSFGQSDIDRDLPANSQSSSIPTDGESRFITDDLYTFLHTGPGRNYRIIGSLAAGAKVTQLNVDNESNFIEVVDEKERRGWVDGRHITTSESIRSRMPILEQQLAFSGEQLVARQEQIDELSAQIEQLNQEKADLQSRYDSLFNEHNQTKNQLSQNDYSSQKDWFIRGGILAFGGVLLGVILTYLPKKRRRNDNWM